MNKKFSTLMASLLLAGGMVAPAFAESFSEVKAKADAKDYDLNSQCFFVYANTTDISSAVLPDGNSGIIGKDGSTTVGLAAGQEEGYKQNKDYLWKVQLVTVNGVVGYKLINVATGKALSAGTFDTFNGNNTGLFFDSSHGFNGNLTTATTVGSQVWFYNLQPVDTNVDVPSSELNDLYNSTGFNLVLNQDKWKDVDNIFAKEGDRIMAVPVLDGSASNGSVSFPKGIYFVVNNKLGAAPSSGKDLYDFLMNSTLIAVSPSVNDINDADWRKAGKGFQLIKKAGRDLVKVGTNKDLQGEDVYVYNACFKVTKNIDGDYALQVPTFYYNEKTDAEKQTKGEVAINVTAKDGDDHGDLYLTTDAKAENFIFDFKEVNTVSYTKFLNQNAKAVYNIQFVNDDLAGKYLFTPAYENVAYAKGAKFVDPTAPEAQYIITDVDLDNNNITFENRANKAYSFTAKFYQEADGVYSMAIKSDEIATTTVTDLSLQANGDLKAETPVKMHTQWVKLTQVSVDKFAGAWDVDNLTEVTMSFARDEESTSNRLFVTVDDEDYGTITVSDNQSDAIQFRLVKDEKPTYITNEYAYLSADNKVKKYADGDTVAYYTYALQAYKDGNVLKKYLNYYSSTSRFYLDSDKDYKFIIRTNSTDGSTILTALGSLGARDYNDGQMVVVADWTNETKTISEFDGSDIIEVAKLPQELHANYVKTFLKVESPEVSLDPKTTYATMTTELENYVAIKNDRDAIITGKETTLRLFATDTDRQIPSFLISTGWNGETGERQFLFNSVDSVDYNVATGEFNKEYTLQGDYHLNKAIFRVGKLNVNNDTIVTTIKGKETAVTNVADQNKNVQAGLNRYKFQIVADEENEGYYIVRQEGYYLFNVNEFLVFANSEQYNRDNALRVKVTNVEAPTANETIAAGNVVVAGTNGAVVVKGAEGKNVIVSTILGKVVANEVVSSDNAQIATPAGIVVVSVDGESFKVVVK